MGNRSRFQILETAEDLESEEEDYLPLISTKPAFDPTAKWADAERERQGTSSGGQDQAQSKTITIRPSNHETATEYTMAREQEIEANRRKEPKEIYHGGGARGRTISSNRGEKAWSETTTCFLFKPRFGEFLGRNQFKTIGQKTNSSYEDGGGYG